MQKNTKHPAFVVSAMIVALALANLFVLWAFDTSRMPGNHLEAFARGLLMGMFIGQLNLISIWAAISQGNIMLRLPWAILLTVVLWCSFLAGQIFAFDLGSENEVKVGMMLLIGCVVTQVPLWIGSRMLKWRIAVERADCADKREQFKIQHMLIGMVLLAIAMGLVRFVLIQKNHWDGALFITNYDPIFFGAALVCNLLLVIPCIPAAFSVSTSKRRIVLALACAVLVSLAEFGSICAIIGGPGREEIEWCLVFVGTNIGQMGIVFICLKVLQRYAGFRFIHKGETLPVDGTANADSEH